MILLIIFIFAVSASVAQTNNYSTSLFSTPENLKPNVDFWIKIYTKYSESEVVIHDSEELNIVYEVINLQNLFKGIYVSNRLQWKKIEQIKKNYASILLKLSRQKKLKIENLHGKEKYVASLFGKDLNSRRFRRAAKRIRAQTGLKERFKQGLERSGLYLAKMKEIFKKEGLPLELLVLPHVESSFNYKAYSKFGAAGIWQFTRSTGRLYMKINYTIDERLDPIRATESAAKLLKTNYRTLGSWPLAITAYNHGLYGMKRAKRKYGNDLSRITKHYKSRSFGFASRNFYAEFLAALQIAYNYKSYFGDINFHESKDYIEFATPDYVTANTLIKYLKMTPHEFAEFNPALRSPVLSSKRRIPKNFKIRIPFREDLDVKELYAQISPEYKFDKQIRPEWHKVRSGENLISIVKKYRVSLKEMMALNNIRNPHLIYVGQNLQIPTSGHTQFEQTFVVVKNDEKKKQLAEVTDLNRNEQSSVLDIPQSIQIERKTNGLKIREAEQITTAENEIFLKTDNTVPVTKSEADLNEETKYNRKRAIAGNFNLQHDLESIEEDINLALPNYYAEITKNMETRFVQIPHEQIVQEPIRELQFPENGQVVIEPDETLGHFADWLGVSAQKLRNINGLSFRQTIQIGQPLWLTFEKVTPEEFHRRRVEYHQGIEEDFYRNYTVEGNKLYKVKPGENIWIICNKIFEIPYWFVEKYNPQKDLLHLKAYDEIVIPIVEAKYPSGLMENAL